MPAQLRRKAPCNDEFHADTGLSLMHEPETRDQRRYRVLVDQAVLSGILDHAYSDPINEIIGHLGGRWNESTHTVYITCFSPSARLIEELRPDSVEGKPTDQLVANQRFNEHGAEYMGWYHSHPRIKPLPSHKDLQMQSEMQSQVPPSVGLICSSWWPASAAAKEPALQLSHYFNAFRVQQSPAGSVEAVKVCWGVTQRSYEESHAQEGMHQTLEVVLSEAEETCEWRCNQLPELPSAQATVKLEYDAFLGRFMKEGIMEHVRGLEQDRQGLMAHRLNQLQQLKQLQHQATARQLPGLSNWSPEGCEVDHPLVVRLLNRQLDDMQAASAQAEDSEECCQHQPAGGEVAADVAVVAGNDDPVDDSPIEIRDHYNLGNQSSRAKRVCYNGGGSQLNQFEIEDVVDEVQFDTKTTHLDNYRRSATMIDSISDVSSGDEDFVQQPKRSSKVAVTKVSLDDL